MTVEIVVFFLVGLVLLPVGSDFMVRGSVAISERLGVSPLIIGLTVVAFGTSLPELLVSLNAALTGSEALAIGNVVGSNIANILLILGAAALISPIFCEPEKIMRDTVAMIGASVLGAVLILTGVITWWQGALLLTLLFTFLFTSYLRARKDGGANILGDVEELEGLAGKSWMIILVATIGGLIGILVGANLLVSGAVGLARAWGVSEEVIGLTMVAFGTSLPELAASVTAALKRHADLALGNVLGSNIFNILGIMGATALVIPLPVPGPVAAYDIWVMLATSILLVPFMLSGRKISRMEGAVFLALYFGYVIWLFLRPA